MICPICGGEMEEGGLIASGISVMSVSYTHLAEWLTGTIVK